MRSFRDFPFETGELAVGILAAGESLRFGSCKQLAMYEGETLLGRSIRMASGVTSNIFVITGSNAGEIMAAHQQPVQWVHNPDYRQGQGSSLRTFAQYLLSNPGPELECMMLLLCDQPRIRAEHLRGLYLRFLEDPRIPAVSTFDGGFGPPSVFPVSWLEKIATLDGSRGAKRILQDTEYTGYKNPEASIDIDTPDDFQEWKAWSRPFEKN